MDPAYITILLLLAVGIVYGIRKKKPAPAKKSSDGWKGLGVLGVLTGGLIVASTMGNEGLTWIFGLSLMAAVPIMIFFAIGSAIGARFRRGGDEEQ